jgi:protein gp37
MADTKIEWAEKVWNPVTGCTKISLGCKNCYAERMSKRLAGRCGYPKDNPFAVTLHPDKLDEPMKWKKPKRIFVCSMGDLFHEEVPFEFIHQIWDGMKACPQHVFLVLTKRPERMEEVLGRIYRLERFGAAKGFWNHVWLGVTAENQDLYDQRVQYLRQIPAAVRFISYEPALGPLVMRKKAADEKEIIQAALMGQLDDYSRPVEKGIDWVICGGESGPGARPMHPDWVRGLRDQCVAAGVPFFFKQWGEWLHSSQIAGSDLDPDCADSFLRYTWTIKANDVSFKVGKKAAGRLLDGQEWSQFPEVQHE